MAVGKRILRWGLALIVVAALAAGLFQLLDVRAKKKAAAVAAATAEKTVTFELGDDDVARAVRTDLRQVARVSGTLNAVNTSIVKAEVAGPILEVFVQRGQSVDKGQPLARLDTEVLRARLNERQSNLEATKAQRALAERTNANNQTLSQKGIVSEIAREQSKSNLDVTSANVRAAEAQVDQARRQLTDALVRSPMKGAVGERWVNPGENVAVDAKLFSLVDLTLVEAEALVPAREVPLLAIGQSVHLRVEGFGREVFAGTIDRINPSVAAGTRAIPVFVRLNNPDGRLKVGMYAQGKVIIAIVRDALAVPKEAVRLDGQETVVYVIKDGKLARRVVTLGLVGAETDQTEITGGLTEGESVVVSPFVNLTDGMPVKLTGQARS